MPTRVFPKEGVTNYAHMVIVDCGQNTEKEPNKCRHEGKREHHHTLNPNGQAMKGVEMTVRRAIQIIDWFDELPKGAKDWQDAGSFVGLRNALGDDSFDPTQAVITELWDRYKRKSLHREVLELAENIVLADLSDASRKEIQDGIRRIRQAIDS